MATNKGVFTGERSENIFSDLYNFPIEKILSVRDKLGFKSANVYFYEKPHDPDSTALWKQILPSPMIKPLDADFILASGGIYETGDLGLYNIVKKFHPRSSLETATQSGSSERYFILDNKSQTLAYNTIRIEEKLLVYNVFVRLVVAINPGELNPPQPEGVNNE